MVKHSGSIIVLLVMTSTINGMEKRSAGAWLDHTMTSVSGEPSSGGVMTTFEKELGSIGSVIEHQSGASAADARAFMYGMAGGIAILTVKVLFDYYMPLNQSAQIDPHLQQQGKEVDDLLKTAPPLTNIASKDYVNDGLQKLADKLANKGYVDTALQSAKKEVIESLTGMITNVIKRQELADVALKNVNAKMGALDGKVTQSIKDLAALDVGLKAIKLTVEGDTKDNKKYPGIVFAHDALVNRVAALENRKIAADNNTSATTNNNNSGGFMGGLLTKKSNNNNASDTL